MNAKTIRNLAVLAIAVSVGGCASYYKVTDPASGRVFYTEDIDRQKGGTTIMFKDAKTGAEVTLPSSEVLQVSSEEFKKATGK
jgi:hypothetical protein